MQKSPSLVKFNPPSMHILLNVCLPIKAIQEIEMLRKHRHTSQTAPQGREWKQSLLRTSWVRGYFPRRTGTNSLNCHLCKWFYTFTQLLAIVLANPRVPDSPTTKIKIAKISETQILAHFAKICTCQNYQPNGSHNLKCYNIVNECSYRITSVFRIAASDLGSDFKSNLAPTIIC